jgi:hypothetical protein
MTPDFLIKPLLAVAEANDRLAKAHIDFLLEHCFTRDEAGAYLPVMIVMNVTHGVRSNEGQLEQVTTVFNLPLLTIVPLNPIRVNTATITAEDAGTEYAIEVGELPLPQGINTLITTLTSNIHPI